MIVGCTCGSSGVSFVLNIYQNGNTRLEGEGDKVAEVVSGRMEFQVEPVARITLQQRIFRQVADLILDGDIAPGEQVTIQALADAFGVSTMPVREALIRLTAAGALTMVTGRSMGIPRLTKEQLRDLRNVRKEVEGVAAVWAAKNIDAAHIKRLEAQCEELRRAVSEGDVKNYLRLNRNFHFSVYEIAQSPTLIALIETLWLRISPYFNLLHGSGNYVISNEHHRELLDALKAGDSTAACKAIHADIQDAYSVLLDLLR